MEILYVYTKVIFMSKSSEQVVSSYLLLLTSHFFALFWLFVGLYFGAKAGFYFGSGLNLDSTDAAGETRLCGGDQTLGWLMREKRSTHCPISLPLLLLLTEGL